MVQELTTQCRASVGCPYCIHGELGIDADGDRLEFQSDSGEPCCHLIYAEWSSFDGANDGRRKGTMSGGFRVDALRDKESDYLARLVNETATPAPRSPYLLKTDWRDSTYLDMAYAFDGETEERAVAAEIRAIFAEEPSEFVAEVLRKGGASN